MPETQIDPGHNSTRRALRAAGPVLAVIGSVLTIVGLADFFLAIMTSRTPILFCCAFVGMPLLFVGLVLISYGYMGKVARYVAQETAPVGKDTFNYVADGTRGGVKTVAGAVGEGLRGSGLGGAGPTMVRCPKCNALAPAEAKFCGQCGQALSKTKPCPNCREWNDPDAKFCDNCGHAFG